jgi:F0F1-type ATP synthase membrane subunit b/b'
MIVEELPRGREPHEVDFGELPELTRALRALGSGRRKAGAMQAHFFRPLMDARRSAESARSATARLRAFDAAALEAGLNDSVDRIVAASNDTREPARRAFRAQIRERVEDYAGALAQLREAAANVARADESSKVDAWRAWTAELRAVFKCADRTWLTIERVLSALPQAPRR